jgi:6-phosphofructokinase
MHVIVCCVNTRLRLSHCRSVAANASDQILCMQLAQNAVHAAMAGYTAFTVGLVNNKARNTYQVHSIALHSFHIANKQLTLHSAA